MKEKVSKLTYSTLPHYLTMLHIMNSRVRIINLQIKETVRRIFSKNRLDKIKGHNSQKIIKLKPSCKYFDLTPPPPKKKGIWIYLSYIEVWILFLFLWCLFSIIRSFSVNIAQLRLCTYMYATEEYLEYAYIYSNLDLNTYSVNVCMVTNSNHKTSI